MLSKYCRCETAPAIKEKNVFLTSHATLPSPFPAPATRSELRVWDAKTMSAEPIATVKLPARVPLGFHALWVSEADLATQPKE